MLGRFSVDVAGVRVADHAWVSRRSSDLVKLLALAPSRRLVRDVVLDVLWPDLNPDAAAANLYKAASYARQAMSSKTAIVLRSGQVMLDPDSDVAIDVELFERAASTALKHGHPEECLAAAGLNGGELLPEDRYEEWTLPRRDALRALHLRLLRTAGAWEEVAAHEPSDEDAAQALLRGCLERGDRHRALRIYARLRDSLTQELGMAPSVETQRLFADAVAGLVTEDHRAVIGRDVDRARARVARNQALEGRMRAVFLVGDAGIGKTTLLERIRHDASSDGWFAAMVPAADVEGDRPYAPLRALVRDLTTDIPGGIDSLAPNARHTLEILLSNKSVEGLRRQAVFSAFRHLVAGVRRGTGTVITVDDAHLLDDASIEVLDRLIRRPIPGVLLVIATRPVRTGSRLAQVRMSMAERGETTTIEVAPLTRGESAALARNIVGELDGQQMAEIWRLGEGNPYYTSELARAAISPSRHAVPADLHDAVRGPLSELDPACVAALAQAAVVGRRFGLDLFLAATGLDAEQAYQALDQAIDAGVLEVNEVAYSYRHELLRQAAIAELPPHRRLEVHRRAATALEAAGAAPGAIAHHYLEAGDRQAAIDWFCIAAGDALQRGAYADALSVTERALDIEPLHRELRRVRAEALFGAGDQLAAAAYREAAALSPDEDRWQFQVGEAWAHLFTGDIAGSMQALTDIETREPVAQMREHTVRGLTAWFSGDVSGAASSADLASSLASSVGTISDVIDTTMLQAMVAHSQGEWPKRLQADLLTSRHLPVLAGAVGDAHLCVAEFWLYGSKPYEEVISFGQDLVEHCRRTGADRGAAFGTLLIAEAELLSGELDDAYAHLDDAITQHRRLGANVGEALALQRLAELHLQRNDPASARDLLASAFDAASGSPLSSRHLLYRIFGAGVRAAASPADALAIIEEGSSLRGGPGENCPACSITFTVPAAIRLADLGATDPAEQLANAARQVIGMLFPRGGGWQAAQMEMDAHLARSRLEHDLADRLLHDAALEYERSGQVLDVQRCRAVGASS